MVVPFQANYVVRLHTKLNRRPNMDARCAFQSTFHFEVVLFVAKGNLNTGWIMLFVSAYSNYINFYLTNFSKNKRFFVFIPFFPNFSLNGIISLSFSYIFLGMPRFFGEGGGVLPKSPWNRKWNKVRIVVVLILDE